MTTPRHFLFLNASSRENGQMGNTEWLARQAASALPGGTQQTWVSLARLDIPAFVDLRHTTGQYPLPAGDMKSLLDATLAATDLVLVSPVYWFSIPAQMKAYLDHWSGWMRTPGVDFKAAMGTKRLWVISTSGDRTKAQPMIDSYRLCAQFLGMAWGGVLWGKGGPPGAVEADTEALTQAGRFLI
jgi:multimeric flavodoxin WrbA